MFDKNTTFGKVANQVLAILVTLALVTLPIIYLQSYTLFQFSMIAVYAILLMGLNILTGLSGQFSLGQGAFYALGAYVAAVFLPYFGVHYYLVFPIAGIIGLVVGVFFGVVAIRFKGPYLAIVTISLALATPSIIRYFEDLTGGATGINISRPVAPFFIPIDSDRYMYLIAIILVLLFFYMTRNLIKSSKGRALTAVRDNEIVASTMGISEVKYKIEAFAISVLYAAIAGSLAAMVIQYISPEVFALEVSIYLIVGLIIGGIASKWGPVYGALYLLYLPNVAEYFSKGAPVLFSGIILILLVMFTPGGTNEIVMRTYYRLKKDFWF